MSMRIIRADRATAPSREYLDLPVLRSTRRRPPTVQLFLAGLVLGILIGMLVR